VLRRLYDATWGRIFALGYDRFQRRAEELGVREQRIRFLAEARGRCLEIGAGTGLNLHRWPEVDELVLSEPDPHMAAQLRRKLASSGRQAEVVQAPAEQLPFPDSSFDTVALTYVLCTVPNVPAALREIDRVLKPGGRLLFLEHVRSPEPGLARWQDRLDPLYRRIANGCHCNRATVDEIRRAGFAIEALERTRFPKAPPIVRPLAVGSAVTIP
jgi:ubiquinone/menaquinone biosynthesis C-methylase UbiE